MIRARTVRTAPRQAILAIHESDPRWPEISRELALDAVAAMSAANGFTLGFACLTAEDAREIAPQLPAGVDLRLPPAESKGREAVVLARTYAESEFERVITVAADTIGISTRLLSTASSVLASEPAAIGLTPGGRVFAVTPRGDLLFEPDEQLETAFRALTAVERLPKRALRLEPLTRLREVDDLDRLTELVAGLERVVPRTIAALQGSD